MKHLFSLGKLEKVLVIVPTVNLKDNEWPNEIKRWGPELNCQIDIECIQTAYTQNESYDLIVVDEIHTTLSPSYRLVYKNISYKYIIGLTATLPRDEEYVDFMNMLCPVIFTVTLDEAVEKSLVSNYEAYNIPVSFNKSERGKYSAYTSMFKKASYTLSRFGNAFEIANDIIKSKNKAHPAYKSANVFWLSMTKRRWLCYKAEKKIDTCVQIIQNIPNRKWIIFCQNIDWAEELYDRLISEGIMSTCYHSKNTSSQRKKILEAAKSPLVRVIVSAQALNTGYNLPAIDAAICTASTSTSLVAIQQLGRILRKDYPDKKGLFINLFVPNTQEEKWILGKNKQIKSQFLNGVKQLFKLVK